MKPLLLTALVLLCARPVAADTALRVSFVTAIAAHTADITTTAYCLGARTCREVNPVMRWAERRPVALGLTKGALAGALQLVPYTLQKRGHRRAALWFNIGQTLAFTAVAVRNSQR